jgi:DNA-binding PadR family transcriptional regulator
MRRKAGTLVPLEQEICLCAAQLFRRGVKEFHGYQLARDLAEGADRRLLTAYGTLYRALGRLEKMGFLESRWEDPAVAAREERPGRRLYRLTAAGEAVARTSPARSRQRGLRQRRRWAPA